MQIMRRMERFTTRWRREEASKRMRGGRELLKGGGAGDGRRTLLLSFP
jgi:hypothetical protein